MNIYCHVQDQNTHISNISSKIRNHSQVIEKNVLLRTSYVTPSVHSYTAARYLYSGLLDVLRLSLWPSAKQPCPQNPSIQRWNCSNYTLRRNDNDNKTVLEPIYIWYNLSAVLVGVDGQGANSCIIAGAMCCLFRPLLSSVVVCRLKRPVLIFTLQLLATLWGSSQVTRCC